ncbi:TolB family protein [Brevibacillus ginsengisoli]|uniref:TolB family protein n=1 Tax=Brevibacillus ginsengisoli TaxID=363854 RepID=UPI003CF986C8
MFKPFHSFCAVLFAIALFLCQPVFNVTADEPLKAAFLRDHNLWMKMGDTETQLTFQGIADSPKWSPDGKWIAFSKRDTETSDSEIWVHNVQTKKTFQAFHSGDHPEWAPNKNILAYQDQSVLDIIDFTGEAPLPFQNVAVGVGQYSWLPDGSGFLATAQAKLLPDGWTNPIIYKIALKEHPDSADLYQQATKFYVLPSTIKKGDVEVLSIGASQYKWSPDRNWISFLVNQTASLSMDSNMLCVLSADGKTFTPIAEIASRFGAEWAPTTNALGVIQGGGRIVFGFTNKQLLITQFPSLQSESLTPRNYADLAFTWLNDQAVIVSRTPEQPWSTTPSKRALPILNRVDLQDHKTKQVSFPSAGYGDFDPIFLRKQNTLTWTRSNWDKSDVWISSPDGTNPRKWIENLESISWFTK